MSTEKLCKRKTIASIKFTKEDKDFLKNIGHSDEDIQEIKYAVAKTTYKDDKGNALSQEEVINRMGRKEWLRGMSKSAFFVDTVRFDHSGLRIRFHSKIYED